VPRSSGRLSNTLRTLYGALTARALVVIESDGPPLQPSLARLCTAETPPPLTIMPLLLERQPAGGTPRCATRARARTVATVGQSAPRSADRSVRRLIPPSPPDCPRLTLGCQATSQPPSARQGARTVAAPCLTSSPPRGHTWKAPASLRSARAAAFCRPQSPPGALRIADAPKGKPLCRSCQFRWRLCRAAPGFLATRYRPASLPLESFSLLGRLCNVLPEGSCVKVRPSRPRCWRTAVAGMARAGNRRRTRVPDEALAVTGGPCGGNVPWGVLTFGLGGLVYQRGRC